MSITRPVLIASGSSILSVGLGAVAVGFYEKTKLLAAEKERLTNMVEYQKRVINTSLHDNDILRATNKELERRNEKTKGAAAVGIIVSAGLATILSTCRMV